MARRARAFDVAARAVVNISTQPAIPCVSVDSARCEIYVTHTALSSRGSCWHFLKSFQTVARRNTAARENQ
eukprot:7658105-Lingulodinium_polyedra.AAC.1